MRHSLRSILFIPALLGMLLLSGVSQAEPVHPQQVIQNVTDKLLTLLEAKKQAGELQGNQPGFLAELETILDPAVDYEKFSKGVMGKYYRKSTPEQRERFIIVFKHTLFVAYGSAFTAIDNETITIQPYTKKLETKATIKMDIHTPGGQIFPVSYSMHLTKESEWKLKNVVVNGLNLGLTFKNQFLGLMSKHRNLDKAIENWSSDVADGSA